jgi:hypothetical protein
VRFRSGSGSGVRRADRNGHGRDATGLDGQCAGFVARVERLVRTRFRV